MFELLIRHVFDCECVDSSFFLCFSVFLWSMRWKKEHNNDAAREDTEHDKDNSMQEIKLANIIFAAVRPISFQAFYSSNPLCVTMHIVSCRVMSYLAVSCLVVVC